MNIMQRLLTCIALSCSMLFLAACDKPAGETQNAQGAATNVPTDAGPVDFDKLESLKGFVVGTGPSIMAQTNGYVFFDPQCPHCAELWLNAQPLYQQVKMKWIPVAFINAQSKTQAGVLLEAQNPVELMTKYEAEMKASRNSAVLNGSPRAETLEDVERNTQAWKNSGAQSVPTILYRDPKNPGKPSMVTGAAPTASIAALFGVTAPAK
jgi:thiol:disulfide interchange protein DsbG